MNGRVSVRVFARACVWVARTVCQAWMVAQLFATGLACFVRVTFCVCLCVCKLRGGAWDKLQEMQQRTRKAEAEAKIFHHSLMDLQEAMSSKAHK